MCPTTPTPYSHEALHEAKELLLVNHTVSVAVDLLEEGVTDALIQRFAVADLVECGLGERSHLDSVEESRFIFIVLVPESVNDGLPLVVAGLAIGSVAVGHLGGGRFVISDTTVMNLIRILFLLLLHGLGLHIELLLGDVVLLLNDLVHEDGLVNALR